MLMANLMFVPFVLAQQLGSVVCSVTTAPPGLADPTSSEQACRDAGGTPGQAPGADVVNTPKITKASWEAAQKDQAACLKFKDDLYNVSKHAFKATWYDKGPQYQSSSAQAQYGNWGVEVNNSIGGQTTGTRCYVVSAWEADWGKDNANVRTTVSKTLETTIKQSEAGIAAEDFAEWQRKDNMEKTAAGPISALIGTVLDALLSVVAAFLGTLAALAGEIFSYAVSQATQNMVLPSAVTIGWGIMRDISNMFFILIMIIIALAAILRVEEYDYRHLLGKVVIIAILVNFSQVIALTIINFVNFVTAVFWTNVGFTDIFGTMMRITNPANAILEGYRGGWSGALVSGLSKNLFMLVSLMVFLALAAMFVIRLVGLYVLVIFSPIAYVAHILPSTQKFGHEWWEKFIKYLIWAPVAVFMIRITMLIVRDTDFFPDDSAFTFVILTAFMAAALLVAEEAGMVGGKAIMAGVHKAQHFGQHLAWSGVKAGANYAAEKYLEKTGKEIRPAKWVEGWEESRKINTQNRETKGALKALEKGSALASPTTFFQRYLGKGALERWRGGGPEAGHHFLEEAKELREKLASDEEMTLEEREATIGQVRALEAQGQKLLNPDDYFTQKHIRHAVAEEQKNIHTENWHELSDLFDSAVREGNQARASALLLKLTDTYNENELINRSRYTRDMKASETAEWEDLKDKGVAADEIVHKKGEFFAQSAAGADNFRKLVLGEELGMGEQGSMMIMSDVSDLAEERGHLGLMRMYTAEHGKLKFKGVKERQDEQAGEMNKMGDDRITRNGNRLVGFDEVPDADFDITSKRTAFVQDGMIAYYMANYHAVKNRVARNEYNASQAMAASLPHNAKRILAAAEAIENPVVKEEYLQTMSALIEYGSAKHSSEAGVSVLDQVQSVIVEADKAAGKRWPPGTEDTSVIMDYDTDLTTIPNFRPRDKRPFMMSDKGSSSGPKPKPTTNRRDSIKTAIS